MGEIIDRKSLIELLSTKSSLANVASALNCTKGELREIIKSYNIVSGVDYKPVSYSYNLKAYRDKLKKLGLNYNIGSLKKIHVDFFKELKANKKLSNDQIMDLLIDNYKEQKG